MPILPNYNYNFASPNQSISIDIDLNRTSRSVTIEIEPTSTSVSQPWYTPFMTSPPRVQRLSLLQHTRQAVSLPAMAYVAETQLWLNSPRIRQRAFSTLYKASIIGSLLGVGTSLSSENINTSTSSEISHVLSNAAKGALLTPLVLATLIIGGRIALNFLHCFGDVFEEIIEPTYSDDIEDTMRAREAFELVTSEDFIMRNIRHHFVNQIKDHWQDMPITTKQFGRDECCPITLTPLFDKDASKQLQEPSSLRNQAGIFEYKDLLLWFIKNPTNPISRQPLDPADFEKIIREQQNNRGSSSASASRQANTWQSNHEAIYTQSL